MENKFKKGLILGGVLAVGAAIGFIMSKEGKEMTDELQKDLKVVAKHLKKDLEELEDITKEKFNELVVEVVNKYAQKKGMVAADIQMLVDALEAKWQEMEEEYLTYMKAEVAKSK